MKTRSCCGVEVEGKRQARESKVDAFSARGNIRCLGSGQ